MQWMDTSQAEAGVDDAPPQAGGRAPAGLPCLDDTQDEIDAIHRTRVGQPLLGEAPHALVGVEFRCVGGQALEAQSPDPADQCLHESAAVHAEPVPDHDHRPAQVAEKMAQVRDGFAFAEVVGVPLGVQAQTATPRADREPSDHRDAVVSLRVAQAWRLTPRRPGARHGGGEHEARFVYEDEVGPQPESPLLTRGQRVRFQRSIAASSRSRARRSGFCGLQPHRASRRPT